MHLSRIRVDLNGLDRDALFAVMGGDAYTAHQLLWRLFPAHDGPRPFLFRQEMEDDQLMPDQTPRGLPLYYTLSATEPTALPGLLGVESKPFAPGFTKGARLAFRLRANPTIARKAESAKHSKRSDVLMHAKSAYPPGERASAACKQAMDAAAKDWLASRGEACGFALTVAPEVGAYRQHALKKAGRSGELKFSSVDYEGLLEVTDPGRLTEMLTHGIGRAKAFGCGLLLLRRI